MSPVSTESISSLRSRTGVSILECKKALEEADGNEEKAIEILRKRGIAQAAKKSERTQSEGLVFLAESDGKSALVLIRCETDFVARDNAFTDAGSSLVQTLLDKGEDAAKSASEEIVPALVQKLGENISVGSLTLIEAPVIGSYIHSNNKIGVIVGLDKGTSESARDTAMHAAAMNPSFVYPEDVSNEDVGKEKEIWTEQLKSEGKPAEIVEKIMVGKEKKFREESSLATQAFVKDPTVTVGAYLGDSKIVSYARVSTKD
jgi:elongation factor Ts